ncbi:GDSL esterase/lipase [Acorus calamus]|uniref:GDSL esterase/lipase n=1 Tax=Acorus calamus TaxID=4465 RepID=A0AAV9D2I1_ACOCL|nr:GDSL esterase/lipase [Acorus calamus]
MKPFTRTTYLAFLLVGFASALASSSKRCEFPMIINFGDSTSDTGGISATFFYVPLPYGETYFHRPAGRFSDGRVMLDFIAEGLGLPYLSAYLDSLGTNFSHGVNFATAGSTIRPQNLPFATTGLSPFSLDIQLTQFAQFKSRSQLVAKQGGVFKDLMPKQEYFSRALYTIDIGGNDIGMVFVQNLTDVEIRAIIHDGLRILASSIKSLYDGGARFFWVHNPPPIGCIPSMLVSVPPTADQTDSVGCSIPLNKMVEYFNDELNKTMVQLRKELPLAVLTYVDIYSAKYELISHAAKYAEGRSTIRPQNQSFAISGLYPFSLDIQLPQFAQCKSRSQLVAKQGFEHPLKACCGYGGGKYNFNRSIRCAIPTMVNGTLISAKSCKDPSTRITFDGYHFTEAANKWMFDHIHTGAYSDPPLSLEEACHRHA